MPEGDKIFQRLNISTDAALESLCKVLKVKKLDDRKKLIGFLSDEYRAAGGNSIRNLFRKEHDLTYKTILIDVVNVMKPGLKKTEYKIEDSHTEENIEDEIMKLLQERIEKKLKKMKDKKKEKVGQEIVSELKNQGYAKDIIANEHKKIAVGSFGFTALEAAIWRFAAVGWMGTTGVGLLISAALIGLSLTGPAYRKTIPATMIFIMQRKRRENEDKLKM